MRRGYQQDTRSLKLKKCVKELTYVGNYLNPQAPFPSNYWIYHAEQPLDEESAFVDRELCKPGALHVMNSYLLVPSGRVNDSGMPHEPIQTLGINRFHNAYGMRCEIVIACNPCLTALACQNRKVVYAIKCRSYSTYSRGNPANPWQSTEQPLNPEGIIEEFLDDYKDKDGEWLKYINAYGRSVHVEHQMYYPSFEKAVQAVIEDADSGALKEKVRLKRQSAMSQGQQSAHGPRGRYGQ